MAPPTAATARKASSVRSTHQSQKSAARPPLRVVPSRRQGIRSQRVRSVAAVSMVLASLLAVVVGQAMLANGQVRLSAAEQSLQTAQSQHHQQEISVAELETPAKIVGEALGQLHLVYPGPATQLPYVILTKPVPTPNVAPASAATTTTLPAPSQ